MSIPLAQNQPQPQLQPQVYPHTNGYHYDQSQQSAQPLVPTQPLPQHPQHQPSIAGPSNYARQPLYPAQQPQLSTLPPSIPQQQQQQQQLHLAHTSQNGHQPQVYAYPVQHAADQGAIQQPMMVPFPQQYPVPPQIPQQPLTAYPQMMQNGMVPNYHLGGPMQGQWRDDWGDEHGRDDNQDAVYSNLEVKHRRRTTPDQLRVLEYWYAINPKPDNSVREHLAMELGMTKRNVQVWFQNRRAKMKGLAKKEEEDAAAAIADGDTTPSKSPEGDHLSSPIRGTIAPNPRLHMTRRASLANGEAAKIQMFVAKRAALGAKQQGMRPPGYVSPLRSPVAGAARRGSGSNPYPTPMTSMTSISPKASPVGRVMPTALHIAAMRNNTRRASMPGAAQLISSGPFTPPRLVSNQHQVGVNTLSAGRELAPIKDHDDDGQVAQYTETDFFTSYITPPSSTYHPSSASSYSYLTPDSTLYDATATFSPNSPLPNPAYSFGGNGQQAPIFDEAEAARQQALFFEFQQKGRLASLASNATTTEGGTDIEDYGSEWFTLDGQDGLAGATSSQAQGQPDKFDPEERRMSAPADLLDQIGLMGLATPNGAATANGQTPTQPLRPSPLGAHFTSDSILQQHQQQHQQQQYTSSPSIVFNPMSDPSSAASSEGPSPPHPSHGSHSSAGSGGIGVGIAHHAQPQMYPQPQHQHQQHLHPHQQHQQVPTSMQYPSDGTHESSISPYSGHSVPPSSMQYQPQPHPQVFESYPQPQPNGDSTTYDYLQSHPTGAAGEKEDEFSFLNDSGHDTVNVM